MLVATWNINGIRKREAEVAALVAAHSPDVLCLQETKATAEQVPLSIAAPEGYACRWSDALKGYSGVSVLVRLAAFAGESGPQLPVFEQPEWDVESRIVLARMGTTAFASVYAPNGGKDYGAKIDFFEKLIAYVAEAHTAGTSLVISGDLNIARTDADVHPSQRVPGMIGQRDEERQLFSVLLGRGLTDAGRVLDPDSDRLFTWWPYWRQARKRNIGWRLDYVLASSHAPELTPKEHTVLREFGTSDHAPVLVRF